MLNKIFLTSLSNSAEKFVLSVQQFSKPDTRKHHTMKFVLPIVAVLDVSYFPKDKIQLEANWFDQLTSKLFCSTMIIVSPLPSPPLPSPDTCPLLITPPVMKLYKPRAYSRNFMVFNLCFTVALQWFTT